VGPARQIMFLLTLLTTLALVLGAIGVYGVISQFATRRRREWSIRIALGLAPSRVVQHVVGRGTKLVAVGLLIGLGGMALLSRLVTPFLYGVRANDATSVVVAMAVLLSVGVLAALIPALRAGRVDPALVLRDQ
jgi:putative ABC transport system permease protein